MAAVDDAVPSTHGAGGGGADTGVAAAAPARPTFVVPASAAACIAVSACVSGLLAYYATLAICIACFAHAVWPDRVDAVLGSLDAHARRVALLARADLEADLRCLRAHPATAPACAAVARWAGGARRRAAAKWAEHRAAAGAAWFMLRLAGRAAGIAANVLLDAAREEAAAHAPSVMGYLRGLVPGISSPATSSKEGEVEDDVARFELKDVVSIVGIAFHLLFSIRFILSFDTISGTRFYCACLVMCGLTVLVADWIDPPDDDDNSDDTDTTGGDRAADGTAQREGDAGDQARLDAELEVHESWQFMYVLIFMAFCIDAFILHATFGPQPVLLLVLAVCNFEVIKIGKVVQQPDDAEGAEGSAAAGVDEAVNTWRWGAVWVFVASSIKVFGICLVVDFYMAALSFSWLCVMADLLLAEEDSLLELYESGDNEDREEGAAASGEDVNGGAEQGAAETRAAEHSDTSSSEDEEDDYVLEEHCDSSEERTNAISSEDEEEDYVLEERCHSSEEHSNTTSSEDEEEDATEKHCDGSEENDEEERQEEPDCSRGGSMDDGWDLVEVDPEMPVKYETSANQKSSSLLPWK